MAVTTPQDDRRNDEQETRPAMLRRRGVIAGVATLAATLAAALLTKKTAQPVAANDGDTFIVGFPGNINNFGNNSAQHTTKLKGLTPFDNLAPVLEVRADEVNQDLAGISGIAGGHGPGVVGSVAGSSAVIAYAGLYGQARGSGTNTTVPSGGIGVVGASTYNIGVHGDSLHYYGLLGSSSDSTGVKGTSVDGVAIEGVSTNDIAISGTGKVIGVFGTAGAGSGIGVSGSGGGGSPGVTGGGGANGGPGVRGFGGAQGSAGGTGAGILGIANGASDPGPGTGSAVYDRAAGTFHVGVRGDSDSGNGIQGTSNSSAGVLGVSTSGSGVSGVTSGTGVVAGLLGSSTTAYGIIGSTTAPGYSGLTAITNTPSVAALAATSMNPSAFATYFTGFTYVQGNFAVSGNKSAAVMHPDGRHRLLYCVESPEAWLEDFGKAKLVGGRAEVKLDAEFAPLVHADDYHVFLTTYGESNGLFVAARSGSGFTVQERSKGTSSRTFSWRVVAKRKDNPGKRLEKFIPLKINTPDPDKLPKPGPSRNP